MGKWWWLVKCVTKLLRKNLRTKRAKKRVNIKEGDKCKLAFLNL